jgi:uncharacterized protein
MTPEQLAYIRYRMECATESLQCAKTALGNDHLRSAVNRLYYACFYLVNALLSMDGWESTKHTGVRSLFDLHWVKTGRLPAELSSFYRELFHKRQQADYGEFVILSRDDVEALHAESEGFVAALTREIEARIRISDEAE